MFTGVVIKCSFLNGSAVSLIKETALESGSGVSLIKETSLPASTVIYKGNTKKNYKNVK